ncbi:MAG: hypothetical protein INR71_10830 [Terriglobus roseus]|nr:hypothetical protein [Terriglobus roseus]
MSGTIGGASESTLRHSSGYRRRAKGSGRATIGGAPSAPNQELISLLGLHSTCCISTSAHPSNLTSSSPPTISARPSTPRKASSAPSANPRTRKHT